VHTPWTMNGSSMLLRRTSPFGDGNGPSFKRSCVAYVYRTGPSGNVARPVARPAQCIAALNAKRRIGPGTKSGAPEVVAKPMQNKSSFFFGQSGSRPHLAVHGKKEQPKRCGHQRIGQCVFASPNPENQVEHHAQHTTHLDALRKKLCAQHQILGALGP